MPAPTKHLVSHAKRRAAERYNKRLNRQSYYDLCRDIQQGRAELVRKVSNSRSIFRVGGMLAVYSNRAHKIVTFLPDKTDDKSIPA